MSSNNMDIRTIRKNVKSDILSKQKTLNHKTYEALLNKYSKVENSKKKLLKLQEELLFYKDKTDTLKKFRIDANEKKQIKDKKKNLLNDLTGKVNQLKNVFKTVNEFKVDVDALSNLKGELRKFIGKDILVEYVVHGGVIPTKTVRYKDYSIPTTFSSWWKQISKHDWFVDSGISIFEYYGYVGTVYIYPQNTLPMRAHSIKQSFLDGITHCVFTPIKKWAENKFEESVAYTTKMRYQKILKDLDVLETQFEKGVPENAIGTICNKLQIDISVDLPLAENETFIQEKSMKKRLRHFRFKNTRFNHVDLNEVVSTDNIVNVSRDEILKINDNLIKEKAFKLIGFDNKNICSITTLNCHYQIINLFRDAVSQFEMETGLKELKIDDIDDKLLSSFIFTGTHYNSTVDYVDVNKVNKKDILHIDMKKAYANFKTCSFYQGFLGKITDFRQTNKIESIGLYKITNINFDKCDIRLKQHLLKMKCYLNNNIYPSPELEMLSSYGITYDIVCGCWGVKPFEFEFNDTMLNTKDEEGITYYAKYCGLIDSHRLEKCVYLDGDESFYSILAERLGEKRVKYYEGKIKVIYPKRHNYHLGHITSFITSYQRISVLEQLMEIDPANIVRVCVDGIYFKQCEVKLKNVFRMKEELNFNNEAGDGYCSNVYERDYFIEGASSREHYPKELHLGAGGTGKTHYNCNDQGLIKPLFLSPSWKLARNKANECDINVSVWARALTKDPEKVRYIRETANTLIIDEVSMMSEDQKEQLFNVYGDMKIIMCGDLGYQLPCIVGEPITEKGFENVVKHKKDYRCNSTELNIIKKSLRDMIDMKYSKEKINKYVIDEFRKLGRVINVDDLKNKYNINDMILCGTNQLKDYYTNLFKGKFDKEKYYVLENTTTYKNGDIIISDKKLEGVKSEVRHCFTVHSIQGETAYANLFIDSSRMFDPCMFYTAISRAKNLNQIYIIENNGLPVYKLPFGKIYKIKAGKKTYIGSTIQSLDKRFTEHKRAYEQWVIGKGKYITSFELMGEEDVKIIKVEDYPCNTIKELQEREAEIIKSCICVNKTFNEL